MIDVTDEQYDALCAMFPGCSVDVVIDGAKAHVLILEGANS